MYKNTIVFFFLALFDVSNVAAQNDISGSFLYTNKCLQCHSENNQTKLIDGKGALLNKAMQLQVISSDIMPPWPPDNTFQQYKHNRALTTEEKRILITWIDSTAAIKYENKKKAETKMDFTFSIRNIALPKNEKDTIWQFKIQCNNDEEIPVSQVKLLSDKLSYIHHCNYFFITDRIKLDMQNMAFASGYSPGNRQEKFDNGCGFLLPKNAVITGELHIPPLSLPLGFDIAIGLNSAKEKIDSLLYLMPFANLKPNGMSQLSIPADTVITFTATDTLREAVCFYALNPHMHLLGKSVQAFAVKPDGDTVPLIRIKEWNFNWQDFYVFSQSVLLPANTVLFVSMTYDNTVANKNNPSHPPDLVTEGWFTNQEMFTFLVLAKKKL